MQYKELTHFLPPLFLVLCSMCAATEDEVLESEYEIPPEGTECVVGLWGENCDRQCGWCVNNGGCHRRTGECYEPGCEPGFVGGMCVEQWQAGQMTRDELYARQRQEDAMVIERERRMRAMDDSLPPMKSAPF